MQGYSSCPSLSTGSTINLIDVRDGNTYAIFKGKDGKCWMSQNLRLIGKTISSSDSNFSDSSFTVPDNNWADSTSSIDKGNKAYTYNTSNASYGIHYNYYAATAGTISGSSNEATQDICPKGWKLPSQTEAQALLDAYGVTDSNAGSTIMQSTPLNFVYSRIISYDSTSLGTGVSGAWWTSTAEDSTSRYRIYITNTNAYVTKSQNRRMGLSVRCVAK